MSLINDALKKAQRERTGGAPETTPVPGGGSRPPIEAQRRANRGPQLTLIAGGAIAGMVLAGGAVWFFRSPPPPTAPSTPVRAEASPAIAATAAPAATPPAAAGRTATPPAAVASQAQSGPGPVLTPAESTPAKSSTSTEPTVSTAARAAATPSHEPMRANPPAPSAAPTLTLAKLAEIVDALRVTGIRPAGVDSKVLLNDRVFRLGDVVDLAHGVRLTGATANSLTFSEPSGLVYTRNF